MIGEIAEADADMKADIEADGTGPLLDREEPVSLMEPLLISEGSRFRGELTDLAVDLAAGRPAFTEVCPKGSWRRLPIWSVR
jgi:hypothetical protein